MKREKSNDEDPEKLRAFVRCLLEPRPSDALQARQERARQAALTGLRNAMETLARCDLSLEERDNTLRTYQWACKMLNSLDITDPGTPEKLVQIAMQITTARDDLVMALIDKGIELTLRGENLFPSG